RSRECASSPDSRWASTRCSISECPSGPAPWSGAIAVVSVRRGGQRLRRPPPQSRSLRRRQGGTLTSGDGSGPILAVRNLEVVYGAAIQVLRGVSLEVQPGKIVTLLGANGAGKTSLLRAVSGLLGFHRGSIPRGTVELYGQRIDGPDASAIVRKGMAQVMEGRRIFAELTVDENLRAGAYSRRDRASVKSSYDKVLDLFPVLKERHRQTAGYLSGGEQQMLGG